MRSYRVIENNMLLILFLTFDFTALAFLKFKKLNLKFLQKKSN